MPIRHGYRRRHPEMFPLVCTPCNRRFRLQYDLRQHNRDKHLASTNGMLSRRPAEVFDTTKDLQRYLKRNVEPDAEYSRDCREVVNDLCSFMKENFPDDMKPQEIIKGGSLGKGTAVKDKSDVDLIFYLPEKQYVDIEQCKRELEPNIIPTMERWLRTNRNYKVLKTTRWLIKLELTSRNGHCFSVDILPRANILKSHSTSDVYEMMKKTDKDTREYYSAALSPLQRDFVSQVPPKVKSLIQKVKDWRKSYFRESRTGENRRLPGSYALELITINEWKKAGSPENFDLLKGYCNILRRLSNCSGIRAVWTANYERRDANSCMGSGPYLVDPANPYNNVMDSSNAWDEVEEVAKATLRSLTCGSLTCSTDWK